MLPLPPPLSLSLSFSSLLSLISFSLAQNMNVSAVISSYLSPFIVILLLILPFYYYYSTVLYCTIRNYSFDVIFATTLLAKQYYSVLIMLET